MRRQRPLLLLHLIQPSLEPLTVHSSSISRSLENKGRILISGHPSLASMSKTMHELLAAVVHHALLYYYIVIERELTQTWRTCTGRATSSRWNRLKIKIDSEKRRLPILFSDSVVGTFKNKPWSLRFKLIFSNRIWIHTSTLQQNAHWCL